MTRSAVEGPRSERRRLRTEAVLAAAWAVAGEHGLAAVSLHGVARCVGIRQPSLYAHVDSKAGLYDAMFAQAAGELLEQVSTATCSESPREAVVEATRRIVQYVGQATRPASSCCGAAECRRPRADRRASVPAHGISGTRRTTTPAAPARSQRDRCAGPSAKPSAQPFELKTSQALTLEARRSGPSATSRIVAACLAPSPRSAAANRWSSWVLAEPAALLL